MNSSKPPIIAPPRPQAPVRFIDSLWTFAVSVALVGPLALPLFWRNPRFGVTSKVLVSIAVIVLTVGLIFFSGVLLTKMTDRLLGGLI
jgi:hypothetical protein